MPSAYLNALHEEGTREDFLREIGRLYDENVSLRGQVASEFERGKILGKAIGYAEGRRATTDELSGRYHAPGNL